MLESVIPSKVRRKILELYFTELNRSFYLREVVRLVDEEVNAVKRELDILHNAKVLLKEHRTNKVFYSLNRTYVFFDEFLRIFTKESNLAKTIYRNISKLGKVKYIAISMKYPKRVPIKEDEIYALFVGVMVLPEIEGIMQQAREAMGFDVNYTVMTDEEFIYRKKNNDPFIGKFLKQPKVMLIGHEDDLLK
jgi:hypothetical protein